MTNYGVVYAYRRGNSENWDLLRSDEVESFARSWLETDSHTGFSFRAVQK